VRTPEERLQGLPDFPFESSYREIDGLRFAYLDEGEGKPVVFFHGEPTWSFLWRKVIPPVRDAGFRCIAPDYAGFGRSDKPTDLGWYTYDRHVDSMAALLEELDVRDATAVVHDWGGPIGLRLAVEHPERFSRLVIMETTLSAGEELIARQRQQLLEVATPVIKLWDGVVAVPLIGTLDSARSQVVMESLLDAIVDQRAAYAILDFTGVPTVDSLVAQHLMKTVAAARLMGAECIVSGIRPAIAQTIVHLGIDLGSIITRSGLADALAYALHKQGTDIVNPTPYGAGTR